MTAVAAIALAVNEELVVRSAKPASVTTHHVYNTGQLPHIAHGHRSLLVVETGRKWVTLLDWTTLEACKVELAVWERMKPEQRNGTARTVRRAMRNMLHYREKTAVVKAALKLVEA